MALPNHNTNISIENQNFRQTNTDLLHGIWHKLGKPTGWYAFPLCTAGGVTVIAIMTINNKTGVPLATTYWTTAGAVYGGVIGDLVTCP